MSKKMKDVFELPIQINYQYPEVSFRLQDKNNPVGKINYDSTARAIVHAVNTHDTLTEQLEVAKKALGMYTSDNAEPDDGTTADKALATIEEMEK